MVSLQSVRYSCAILCAVSALLGMLGLSNCLIYTGVQCWPTFATLSTLVLGKCYTLLHFCVFCMHWLHSVRSPLALESPPPNFLVKLSSTWLFRPTPKRPSWLTHWWNPDTPNAIFCHHWWVCLRFKKCQPCYLIWLFWFYL